MPCSPNGSAGVRLSADDGSIGGDLAKAAAWLEKITRDPLADAVPGRATVVAASAPAPRGRYQECTLDLTVDADGIPPTAVRQALVFPVKRWPRAGDTVPARISRSRPEVFDADWDRLSPR